MTVEIATLRNRVVIQLRTTGKDTHGQRVLTWTDVATVWAAITTLPAASRESPIAQAVQAESTHDVTIRYRTGVTPALRLRWNTRYFQIHAVSDPDGRKIMLVLSCSEGLNAQ